MASYEKRGDSWRAAICYRGVREKKTFPSKREAVAWATAREAELAELGGGGTLKRSLRHALERYRDEVSPTKRGERWEVVRINSFLKNGPDGKPVWPLVDRPMRDIQTADLAAWRDERLKKVKGASVLREIGLLRAVWAKAKKEWRYTNADPWEDLAKPKDSRARERIFTDEEVNRIVQALGWIDGTTPKDRRQETAVALLLALETAMRSGELLSLEWADVDLERRVARLQLTKNGDARDVPLSRRAVELLKCMQGRDETRVFTLTPQLRDTYYRQARDMAGVEGVTFHDARATACTRLAKKLSVLELARMIGHRDLRSLQVYYRESAEDLASRLD